MELDKRILEGKHPLTCFDEMESRFIGTDCYFSDNPSDYADLSNCQVGCLLSRNDMTGHFNATKNNSYAYFNYCLPAEWVKKDPKYRPYKNVQELFEDIGVYIGDSIHFRSKATETESHALITSYTTLKDGTEKLCLGGAFYYTMQALFDLFELRSRGEWMPFGVLDNGDKYQE